MKVKLNNIVDDIFLKTAEKTKRECERERESEIERRQMVNMICTTKTGET